MSKNNSTKGEIMSKKKELFPQTLSFDFEVLTVEPWGDFDAVQLRQSLVSRIATLTDEQLLEACYVEDDEHEDFSGWDRELLERFHPYVERDS
jgi:hypothetical protein